MTTVITRLSAELHRREVLILANPVAGSGPGQKLVQELTDGLSAQHLCPHVCHDREEFSRIVSTDREHIRCVVAAGGDGTLAEVLNRAPGLPVALLPLGTENVIARHFGLARSGAALAATIVAGHLRHLDTARVNGRVFALLASVGLDADVVHRLHNQRRGHITRLSYAAPILKSLWCYAWPTIDVTLEPDGERLHGALVLVANLSRYGGDLPFPCDGQPDDGWLNVHVFQRPGWVDIARYALAYLRFPGGRIPRHEHRLARQVRITSLAAVPVQVDGDPLGTTPVTIEIAGGSFPLLVPAIGRGE